MLVIGSVALAAHIPGIRPKDVDVIISKKECTAYTGVLEFRGMPVEVTVAEPGSTDEILVNTYSGFAPLDVLYWLKMSHRFKKDSPHFEKTRNDILAMRNLGVEFHEPQWFKAREAETYTNTLPKLNVSKETFFGDSGVTQHYDHDWLHTVVARIVNGSSTPSYTHYMKYGAAVACDKGKFYGLPELTRLHGVIEETMVLALERSIIPRWIVGIDVLDGIVAFKYALQKVCTSITSGWFRDYAWKVYDRVLWNMPPDFESYARDIINREGVRLV